MHNPRAFLHNPNLPRLILSVSLIILWALVLAGVPAYLPVQAASWLVFLGLLITPGYLLAGMIGQRLSLDSLEQLALAFPLGVLVLAVPGMIALLGHLTIVELATGWMLVSAAIVGAWLVYGLWSMRRPGSIAGAALRPWAVDEILLLLLIAGAFVASLPALTLNKIDGDAYAVASFAADALAGLPLNATEPLFGTDLGPGVRMVFNQTLPMTNLWSYLSGVDPITLSATASRSMLALWVLLASYALGKGAVGSRRFGLLVAAIQMLIYVAAPFFRGDNVSLFFFERTNADKFLVPTTMLPVVFAFSIRFVREGQRDAWWLAALTTAAVSTIHPLVSAMLALGLVGFGTVHLLLSLKSRVAWTRSFALAGLVVIVMALPLGQLVLARGEAPLASSFPSTVEGWPTGQRMVPALPYVYLPTLDYYGPLPQLQDAVASDVETATNPFLMWRVAVNMNRRRLILLDLDRYFSDPNLILEPPYLLALLLLPLLLWRIRSNVAAQFALGSSLAVLLIMFNPLLTPVIGSLVMPWILWRFVWVLPYALVIALVAQQVVVLAARLLSRPFHFSDQVAAQGTEHLFAGFVSLVCVVATGLALGPAIGSNFRNLEDRTTSPYYFPAPPAILAHLSQVTQGSPATVLANQDLSVTIPAYVANAHIVAHRMPTTSEVFPADQQDVALQRLVDQDAFFRTPYLTATSLETLRRYGVRFVVTHSGTDLDTQLRLASDWFEWIMDDQSFSLYAVRRVPEMTATIRGNTAMARRQWEIAEQFYQSALAAEPGDLLALLGLAEIAHARGQFDLAQLRLQQAVDQADLPNLHYRLGQLHAEQGQVDASIAEFEEAQSKAPQVARFHEALGDACLTSGDEACAAEQYRTAAVSANLPDPDSRLIAQADLWRQRGRVDQALPLYEEAAALRPSVYNQLMLYGAYREAGLFDRAETLIQKLQAEHPLEADVVVAWADLAAVQGQIDHAASLLQYAIWLQDVQGKETVETRLTLAELLLDANRIDEVGAEIDEVLRREPYNASAYGLQGEVLRRQRRGDEAMAAYQRAFELDPTRIDVYLALRNELRRNGGQPEILRDLLSDAIRLNSENASLLLDLGDQLQRLGDSQAALDTFRAALEALDTSERSQRLNPRAVSDSRAFTYARMAALYEDQGQIDPAMNFYQAAASSAPEAAWPQALLADAWRRRNDFARAEAMYTAVLQQDPTYVDGYLRLADLYSTLGREEEARRLRALVPDIALARLRETSDRQLGLGGLFAPAPSNDGALQSDETLAPDGQLLPEVATDEEVDYVAQALATEASTSAIRALAGALQVRKDYGQAIRLYQRQIEAGEEGNWEPVLLARLYNDLGDLYLANRQFLEARHAYEQALGLDAWWPDARLGLAEVFASQGDISESLQQLQAAVEMAPGAPEAQLALANLLDQKGETNRALAIYQATATAHPGNAEATLAYARALRSQGQRQEAEAQYRHTIELNPGVAGAYAGLAELYIDDGRFEEAGELLHQAIAVDQRDVTAFIRLGDLEQRLGNPDAALAWYDRAADLSPAGDPSNATLLASLLQYGNYKQAQAFVSESLLQQPESVELLLYLADIERALGNLAQAEAALAKATAADPADSRPHAQLAAVRLDQGDAQGAIDAYRRAIDLRPDEASYYQAAAQIWLGQGQSDQALTLLGQGQERVLQSDLLTIAIHDLLMLRGSPDRALATLEAAIQEKGVTPELLLALGQHYEAMGDLEQAEQQYQLALGAYPAEAQVHIALANLAWSQEEAGLALYHYAQATLLDPAGVEPFLAVGQAYQAAGARDEALKAFEQVLAFEPTLVDAYVGLAELYQDEQQWEEAEAIYQQGLAVNPASGVLLSAYADYLVQAGRTEEALAMLDAAIVKSPTAVNYMARARVLQVQRRLEEALQSLETALDREPGSVDVLLALGDLYLQQRQYDQARDAYERVVSQAPGLPVGYIRLGRLANSLGDRKTAAAYAEAARRAVLGSLPRPYDE